MTAKRLTLKQLAAKIGLSAGTVSEALRDSPRIKESTREYVQKKALEFGFSANPWARKMQANRTGFVSIVLPELTTNLVSAVTRELVRALRKADYASTVQYVATESEVDIFHAPADAYLLVAGRYPQLRARLEEHHMPYLIIDPDGSRRPSFRPSGPCLYFDRYQAGKDAVGILLSAGCRSLAFAGVPAGPKYDGFVDGLTAAPAGMRVVTLNLGADAPESRNRYYLAGIHGRSANRLLSEDSRRGAGAKTKQFSSIDVARLAGGRPAQPVGVWVASFRDMAGLRHATERNGIALGESVKTLYWGSRFSELPGYGALDYIGDPEPGFYDRIISWIGDPTAMPAGVRRVRMIPNLGAGATLS